MAEAHRRLLRGALNGPTKAARPDFVAHLLAIPKGDAGDCDSRARKGLIRGSGFVVWWDWPLPVRKIAQYTAVGSAQFGASNFSFVA